MKKSIYFLLTFFATFFIKNLQSTDIDEHSLTEKIASINMKTFNWEDEWFEENDTFDLFLKKTLKRILSPSCKRKRNLAFNLFREHGKTRTLALANIIDTRSFKDLNLFKGSGDKNKYLGSLIDRTQTEVGTIALFSLLAAPTTSIATLKNRQAVIKTFLQDLSLQKELLKLLAPLQKPESALLSFWHQNTLKQPTKRCYFESSSLKSLNNSNEALLLRSLSGHASNTHSTLFSGLASAALIGYGLVYATNFCEIPKKISDFIEKNKTTGGTLLTNVLLNWVWGMDNRMIHSAAALAAGVWCGLTTVENYKKTKSAFLVEKCVHKLTAEIAFFFSQTRAIYNLIDNTPTLQLFEEFQPLIKFFKESPQTSALLQELFTNLSSGTFDRKSSFLVNKGIVLRSYKLIDQVKKELEEAIVALGKIDAYFALARLMQETSNQEVIFSFAEYTESGTPLIVAQDFWHPFIQRDKVIPNSIILGTDSHRPHVVLTGPNEGGKSTIIKALATCLVMAQSVGIVPASTFVCSPFSMIATALNVTDDLGSGSSLFKASVQRVQEIINAQLDLQSHQFSFVIFDEIFHGTSPQESEQATFGLAKQLDSFTNNISIISTHLNKLTIVEQTTTSFCNYKVSAIKYADGHIEYPFLLEPGIFEGLLLKDCT